MVYSDSLLGLRFDAGLVQNELRYDMAKLLLSAGFKIDAVSQLVFSAGWLQCYVWWNFDDFCVGKKSIDIKRLDLHEQGLNQTQYIVGAEYKRELLSLGAWLILGLSISL